MKAFLKALGKGIVFVAKTAWDNPEKVQMFIALAAKTKKGKK